jgi:hypothetical protein
MLSNREISDEHWTIKRDEIKAEHFLERAPEDLRMGWKAWITAQGPGLGKEALVPLRWSQPLESPWCSEIELVLCA